MVKRYSEQFFCDALELAQLLAKKTNGTISEGIGQPSNFPLAPKVLETIGDSIRFLRVEGDDYFEVSFITMDNPTNEDALLRKKCYYRVYIGQLLHNARLSKGISLQELSLKTSLRVHALERIEEGKWDMDVVQLGILSEALGCSILIK